MLLKRSLLVRLLLREGGDVKVLEDGKEMVGIGKGDGIEKLRKRLDQSV